MIIKDGCMDAFLEECRKIRPVVLKEKGCLMYTYTREFDAGWTRQEPVNPNRVTLFESWESVEDSNAHSETAHMKEFVAKVAPMRESVVIRAGRAAF
jgi:quinol monooxygenase YgiN